MKRSLLLVLTSGALWMAAAAQAGTLKFNGTSAYVSLENSVTTLRFTTTNSFSIEAWVKVNSLATFQTIVGKYNSGVYGEYYVAINTNGQVWFHREVGPTFAIASSNSVPVGVWTHVAVTYTNGTRRIYFNGQLDPVVDPGSGPNPTGGPTTVLLGARHASNVPVNFLNGELDEVRFWNTTRSTAEIQANLNRALTGDEPGLVAYYRFDEGGGLYTLDGTKSSSAGVLTGGPVWNPAFDALAVPIADSRPASSVTNTAALLNGLVNTNGIFTSNYFQWGPGSMALAFDGVNDLVTVPHHATLNPLPFTVTAWVKVAPGTSGGLVNKYVSGNNGWRVIVSNGRIHANYFRSASQYIGSSTGNNLWGSRIDDDDWHHVAFTVSTNGGALYVDGQVPAEGGWVGAPAAPTATDALTLGNGAGSFVAARIDDVAVWNVALDGSQIAGLIASGQTVGHPQYSNVVGHWDFEDGAGTVATDVSGHNHDGTLTGGPVWWPEARPILTNQTPLNLVSSTNKVLDLDGVNDYVDVPEGVWFDGDFTVEFRAFVRKYSNYASFLDFGNGPDQNNLLVSLSEGASGQFSLWSYAGSSGSVLSSPTPVPLNQWVHLAVTLQGSRATLYLNGVQWAQGIVNIPSGVFRTNTFIGRPNWPQDTYPDTLMDDVRIWNTARTADQIRQFMDQPVDPGEPALLLNYRFDETSGPTVVDSRTLSPQNGIRVGATLLSQATPSEALSGLNSGAVYHFRNVAVSSNRVAFSRGEQFATVSPGSGTALHFDGRNDYVIGSPTNLPLGNSAYTIEAWIKPDEMNSGGIVGWGPYGLNNQVNAFRLQPNGLHNYWWNNDLTANTGPLTDRWHHVAATFDGNIRSIYLDGTLVASAPAVNHNVPFPVNFTVGKTYANEYFKGSIDELRIWNIGRTGTQIQQDMNGRLNGDEPGLVVYYRMDEGSGSALFDATANQNAGLLLNDPFREGSKAPVGAPVAVTLAPSGVTLGNATFNGTVNGDGSLPSRYWFEYGSGGNFNFATPEVILSPGTSVNPVIGVVTNLGISPGYNYRLVAANDNGTNYGGAQLFVVPVPAARTALQFDGIDNQVVVGTSAAHKATTGLTAEAWIYPTGPGSDPVGGGIIVNREGEYEFARFPDGTLRWAMAINAPNNWLWVSTGIIAPLNQWMHVALTYNRTNVVLYTNGVFAYSAAASGNIGDVNTAQNELRVGGRQGLSQFFAGQIDEVRVWTIARSAAQIAANFNRPLITPQSGLGAYLRFDEGFGGTTINRADLSNASLFGGPLWVPSGAGLIEPLVTTLAPAPVLATSATLRGTVNPSGESVIGYFEYGTTVTYGNPTTPISVPGNLANVPFSATLSGLEPGTTYHYRMVAYNTVITNYGADQAFTTLVLGFGWPVSTKLTGGESSSPRHVVDPEGNTYLAGLFSGSASFKGPLSPSGATVNAFIGKLADGGDWLWATNIPCSPNGFTLIKAVAVDPARNVYVAGQFSGTNTFGATNLVSNGDTNLFIAKLDANGTNWLWARNVGGVGFDSVNALTIDSSTNIFVAGQFSGNATFDATTLTNAGGTDIFVARLDSNGNWLWANSATGTGLNNAAFALLTDANTNIFVAGQYSNSATFAGTTLTNAGGADLFLAKLNPAGAWVLARRGGSVNNDIATGLARDAANVYLVGQFGGTANYGGTLDNVNTGNSTNIFVLKLDAEGGVVWYTQGGSGFASAISTDASGHVYVTGDFAFATQFGSTPQLISSGNRDVFIAQLDAPSGNWIWAKKVGSTGNELSGSLGVDASGSVVFSGTYQNTIDLGFVLLTSPNNQDIFVARIDANQVYEHNNYTIGQPIPVPVDARDPGRTDQGAFRRPGIIILESEPGQNSDGFNSFIWGEAEHKLYPVRQVTAVLKWALTDDPTNTTSVATLVGRTFFPTNPQIHVANAPVNLEPNLPGFPLKFFDVSFTTNGAAVDLTTKQFNAPRPGWSVLQFLETGGVLPNPDVHPSRFEVVLTVAWNDPRYLLNNQPAVIGTALTHPTHDDHTGANGYLYFENAFYDGAGDERAYNRATRIGPIIPVNKDTAATNDDLVVVWYRTSPVTEIAWPSTPAWYLADWPTNADQLVLASRLGSGPLSLVDFPSRRVYNQPDKTLPGFNPNEEHAALYGEVLYALRNDLNDAIIPKVSEPYTLLKYLDPDSGQWAMKVYQVVTTNATFQLAYSGEAGSPLQLPEPLTFLNVCNSSNRIVSGPGFQDYTGRLYARAAGPGTSGTNIVARYWYPLQPGFFYDLNLNGTPDVPVGTCIPWLDRRPNGSAGTPADIQYAITWPAAVPTLQIGDTLFGAKLDSASLSLPGVRKFADAVVIFDQANPFDTNAPGSLVRLFDPLSERTLQLTNFLLPAGIRTVNDAGRLVFADLPYAIRSRLRFDSLNKRLSFGGLLNESVDVGGPNNPLLLINVLSPRERDRIAQLSTAPAFLQAVTNLYDLTRNPNRLDVNRDGQPDKTLLIGLTYTYQTNQAGVITTNIGPEKLGAIPKVLTTGPGTGSGFVTIVENNNAALGLPVTLHVLRVDNGPFRGDIKVLYPDNVFDEKLSLRHSADFGGEPQRFEFQWFYKPDETNFDSTDLPIVDGDGNITDPRGWQTFVGVPPGVNGVNDITVGDSGQASLLTLSDNWFVCRYRGYAVNGQTNWSDWVGAIGGGQAQLAEGWVKRVVFGLNPFETRTKDFHANETATFASMLRQAGPRYEGDVSFDPAGDNVNNLGLIQAYETVLRRAKRLSIDAVPGFNFAPANNALLLAAGRIADFYMLLGNEAYADAADPTIGFRTDAAGYGTLAPSIFAFQNQLDSLLEEELSLLRGRDDRSATVRSAPAYNRLFWNFTHDEGEVAYAQAYNISDQNSDGFITADDARIMYPQAHGDAWGHYLTATKTYYSLLQNTNFEWIARAESILLAGVPVTVDFLDERKFARAAAAKAKAGAEIVDLSYRLNYVDDPAGQFQGYKDTDAARAWGLSEWGHRAGSAAFFDWVTANAILPAADPNTNHAGLTKIDRTTVTEIGEIGAAYRSVQDQVDKADLGLNPLGLVKNVVPFDIDPALIAGGKTHFEQIYDRAIEAMKNSVTVFNHANQLSQALRRLQDTVTDFSRNADQQERDFKNRLIEIFGYPFAGDIGPGKTYPAGYNGPDLYHYMYVSPDLTGVPPAQSFTAFFTPLSTAVTNIGHFFPEDLPALQGNPMTQNALAFSYPQSAADYAFVAPTSWAQRQAPGALQEALSTLLQKEAAMKRTVENYDVLIARISDALDLLEARYDVEAEEIHVHNVRSLVNVGAGVVRAAGLITERIGSKGAFISRRLGDIASEGFPKVVGTANDVTSVGRVGVLLAAEAVAKPFETAEAIGAVAAEGANAAKELTEAITEEQLRVASVDYELQQQVKALEQLMREEAPLRVEIYQLREAVNQAAGQYLAKLAEGLRLVEERVAFRKAAAAETQASRYQDMTFRIFRNDAIQKYRAQFDLAARYVFLAGVAYDFETQLLGGHAGAGREFLTDIIRQRALGELLNGVPIAGRHGLADPLARLSQNFGVLKGQLGFNNPQTETGQFSLRNELFRMKDSSTLAWQAELKKHIVPDLWAIPEFRRYCRPFAPESAGPQPGLIIRFPTTVTFGLNYFGWPLGGGDSAYDPTLFATKVRSAGVWFSDYNGSGLSQTPRVYLVPAGADIMRSPSGNNLATREWRVVDQKIPVPFPIGFSSLNNPAWIPMNDSLSDTFADIRRFSSFRAYHDSGVFNPAETATDTRLIGRSVWNTDWILIIPGGTFLFDPNQGLDTFINSVSDIKIFYQTYAYSGN